MLVSISSKDLLEAFVWFSTVPCASVSELLREHRSVQALSPLSPVRLSDCTKGLWFKTKCTDQGLLESGFHAYAEMEFAIKCGAK